MKRSSKLTMVAVAILALGCSTSDKDSSFEKISELEASLTEKNLEIDQLKNSSEESSRELTNLRTQLASADSDAVGDYPLNAEAGQCFSKVMVPAKYKTVRARVEKHAEGTRLQVIPAQYRWTSKRVEVTPAQTRLVTIPAKYGKKSERIKVQDEQTVWRKSSQKLASVGAPTMIVGGEALCKVKIPAKYKTITKTVELSPAQTREVVTPATFKTMKVKELVREASTREITTPATYQTVVSREKVSDAKIFWSEILCKDNASRSTIVKVQKALKSKGYNPGKIDGVLGNDTLKAVNSFQKSQNLAQGALTMNTVKALTPNVAH